MLNIRPGDVKKKIQRPGQIALYLALVAVASTLRIEAARNSLWLDEIWSLDLASRLSSPLDIFYKIHSDNNHYLNALWLYFTGFQGDWPGYRIPSILAGIGSVVVAGLIAHRRNAASAFVAMLLTSFSYVLVLYASEARGYSTLVFFSLFSYYWMDRYLETRRWRMALAFSLVASLGLLSHLTFVSFLFSSFLWAAFRLLDSHRGFKDVFVSLTLCYLIPMLLLVLLYLIDIHFMVIVGGDQPGLFNCYMSSLAWALGMPPGFATWMTFGIAAVIFILEICLLWQERPDLAVFFTSVVVIMPILLVLTGGSDVLYVRYFIISIAFFLILLSFLLASLCASWGNKGRVLCGLLLAGYLAANGGHLLALFKYGRGNNAEAIHFLLQNSNKSAVTVGGDQDFRIGTVLDFYSRTEIDGPRLKYFPAGSWPTNGVEWLICEKESYEDPVPPGKLLVDPLGRQYDLVRIFPTAPLSGLHWFIYHNRAD